MHKEKTNPVKKLMKSLDPSQKSKTNCPVNI